MTTTAQWLTFDLAVGGSSTSGSWGRYLNWTANPYCNARAATLMIGDASIVVLQSASTAGNCTPLAKPTITGVFDSVANNATLAPGQWVSIYGKDLSDTTRIWTAADFAEGLGSGNSLPTSLDGVSVLIGAATAAAYYVSPTQLNVQVPAGLSAGSVAVRVRTARGESNSLNANIGIPKPAFYSYRNGNVTYASAINSAGRIIGDPGIVSGTVPVRPGEIVSLFASGLDSSIAGVTFNPLVYAKPINVTAAGIPLKVLGVALIYPGQYQINVELPQDLNPGRLPLKIVTDSSSSCGFRAMSISIPN